jgi:sugar-specific transcriptional regulator TrmB
MNTQLETYLRHIGLSEKEIQVYEFLLSVDSALPIDIAREIHMKRSTVYVIIELLKAKGMVRVVTHGKRDAYIAEDIERIRFLLQERKLKTEEHIQNLDKILPELKSTLRKKGRAPIIKFYEGEHAVQESMSELVSKPKFLTDMDYAVFPLELIHKLFKHKNLKKYILCGRR